LVVGLATLAVLLFLLFRLLDWAAEYVLATEVTWWQDLLLLFGFFLAVGISAKLLPPALRLYGRALGRFIHLKSTLSRAPDGLYAIDARREYRMPLALLFPAPKRFPIVGQVDLARPYIEVAIGFREDSARQTVDRIPLMRRFAGQLQIQHLLVLTGDDAQLAMPCWEAVLGTWPDRFRSFSLCRYVFRRAGRRAWRVEDPFPGRMTALAVSSMRQFAPWPGVVNRRNIAGDDARALPIVINSGVGAVMIQAEVSLTDTGIRFRIPGSHDTFNANDVARVFPNLRLFVLLGLDRNEAAPRTPTDRLIAAHVRAAAHELFNVAAPAVICIPGLPSSRPSLADETLQIIGKVVRREPENAVWPLQSAVRDIQEMIFAKCGLSTEDSTELAYDVCYYAADVVNMKVDPDQDPKRTYQRGVSA
jgi:hypothetical protein